MSDNPKNTEANGNFRDEKGRFVEGNPGGGRPKGISLVKIIEEELQKRFLTEEGEIDRARKMMRDYLNKIEETQSEQGYRDLIDRFDGKPTNKTEVTGANGEPITLKVEFVTGDESK